MFDAVYALEKQKYDEGQTEGIEEGHKNHYQQGFLLGWQQACHLLRELGTVEGELSTFIAFGKNDKIVSICDVCLL